MKSSIIILIMLLITGGVLSAQQTAGVPNAISYQGMVTSSDGNPLLDGEYPITVTLYGDKEGTVEVWRDTYMTTVQGGVFTIYLGSGKVPLPAPGQMDRSLWIGTRIAEGEEMRPLTRLGSSPYAINVPDESITTNKLADGAVTEEKMSLDYLSGVSVNGKKIEIDGKVLNIQAGKDIDIRYDEVTKSLVIGSRTENISDREKDAGGRDQRIQGTASDSWSMRGEGVDPNGNPVAAAPGDWIGTNAPGGVLVDFNIHAGGLPVMRYQPRVAGTTPNVVGGFSGNSVGASAVGNVIAGGGGVIVPNTIAGDSYNAIGGGAINTINNTGSGYGVIGGGQNNQIATAAAGATHATVGGGQANQVTASHGTVGGGQSNAVSAAHGAVGGGQSNAVGAAHGTVAGGSTNRISGALGAIGGGGNHSILHVNSTYGAIGGGLNNEIGTAAAAATHGTIGGGQANRVTANHGAVGGGQSNVVSAAHGAISGGSGNQAQGPLGAIGGGGNNRILRSTSNYGSIGGGQSNEIGSAFTTVNHGTIGGGLGNRVLATYGTVGGGVSNFVGDFYSTVAGGVGNNSSTQYGSIGGGSGNLVVGNGIGATIPGGEGLIAQSYGQTVTGVLNIPKGNVAPGDPLNDEPIFIIGNGIQGNNSNAFEVSYNGHSTVFHETGGATPVIHGSTYIDNIIYSWGMFDPFSGNSCFFGVSNFQQRTTGWYEVTMDIVDPDGNPVTLNCASVTATVLSQSGPGGGPTSCGIIIMPSQVVNNVFDIYIMDINCNLVDEPFSFKVTGRP